MRRSWVFAAGQPVIALTTIGRHSGIPHTTTVAVLCHNDKVATVGMNLGMKRNPAWTYNLDATPAAQITLGGRTIAVAARRAVGDEHAQLWNHWLDVQPSAAAFAQLAGREIPIFVLEPG
jgi:deazaflavin-dependent oxidoreductase (nitroreductase family)